jgi:hypothetical protein
MVGAPDLTAAAWQDAASDARIRTSIRGGRGKMPAFPDLSDAALDALVARIRRIRAR